MNILDEELKHPLNSRMFTCPAQGKWTSFQLVYEIGEGQSYTALAYAVVNAQGHTYKGKFDATGTGKVENHFAGPIALTLASEYTGTTAQGKKPNQTNN